MVAFRDVEYVVAGRAARGLWLAQPEAVSAVLLLGTWEGQSPFVRQLAQRYHAGGHDVFVADIYGEGAALEGMRECQAAMDAVLAERQQLPARVMAAAMAYAGALAIEPPLLASRLALAGYCFGGLCVLDCVRAGFPAQCALSFHGLLHAPKVEAPRLQERFGGKLALYHGYRDPMARPDALAAVQDEMALRNIAFDVLSFSEAVHAFTNPNAAMPGVAVYDAHADAVSWHHASHLLAEISKG